ncbi:DUF3108 domain-containing protein [Ichthyenterobacterium sp. W332]|uniref:DUF3108 domain-containing protein n=1 Tax=Microcosmobacter mediterraneus TaxID=3075607 RepID=A0ABU2YHI4_9FLAO|nr:DUF3108 domain-containing protein [Ichthyenterobacterium sp. W332]MDT0557634.1 DUF3108 domain-containing protein [Ichthyenterobacterium sp. W332]
MKHFSFYIISLLCLNIFSQNKTIVAGENLTFTASYNMSGILTDLAEVTMQTSEIKTSKTTLLRLKCKATTYSKWDSFFKIRDLYESYVSPKTLTPFLYKRDINEGGYYKFMQYKFNHKTKTVQSLKKKKKKEGGFWEEKKSLSINSSTKDLVSTLYHIRNLDIDKANIGDNMDFKILFDNVENIINVRYLGKETISTNIGRKECYKLSLSVKNNDVLKGSNANLLWLTADQNKVPVYAKFKIAVGSGELKIKSATGLN